MFDVSNIQTYSNMTGSLSDQTGWVPIQQSTDPIYPYVDQINSEIAAGGLNTAWGDANINPYYLSSVYGSGLTAVEATRLTESYQQVTGAVPVAGLGDAVHVGSGTLVLTGKSAATALAPNKAISASVQVNASPSQQALVDKTGGFGEATGQTALNQVTNPVYQYVQQMNEDMSKNTSQYITISSVIQGAASPTVGKEKLFTQSAVADYLNSSDTRLRALSKYLTTNHADHDLLKSGQKESDNALVAGVLAPVLPQLISYGYSYDNIVKVARFYQALSTGQWDSSSMSLNKLEIAPGDIGFDKAFKDCSLQEQQNRLAVMIGASNGLGMPPDLSTLLSAGLIKESGSSAQQNELLNWSSGGGLIKVLFDTNPGIGNYSLESYMKTQQGQMMAGALFGIAGAVGGFATGGPMGGVAAMSFVPFASTEWANLFQMNQFGNKNIQQATGEWAPDQRMVFDQEFKSYNDLVTNYSIHQKDLSPQQRKDAITGIQDAYDALSSTAIDKYVYLAGTKSWESDVNRLDNMDREVSILSQGLDSSGNLVGTLSTNSTMSIQPPKGWHVETPDGPHGFAGEPVDLTGPRNSPIDVTLVNDTTGEKVGKTYYFPKVLDTEVHNESVMTSFGEAKLSSAAVGTGPSTFPVVLQPGQTLKYGDTVISTAGIVNVPVDHGGVQGITISQAGKQDYKRNLSYAGEGVQGTINPTLSDVYKPFTATEKAQYPGYGMLDINYQPGQKLMIGNEDYGEFMMKGAKPLLPVGTYTVKVSQPGFKDFLTTAYVKDGQTYAIDAVLTALTATGSSGGSGGSGGGGGGGSKSAAAPKATVGIVIFGPGCEGANVYLDGTQIYPVIGQQYSESPGYHGFRLTKLGFEDWIKSVYFIAGESQTISPEFIPSTTSTTGSTTGTTKEAEQTAFILWDEPCRGSTMILDGVGVTPEIGKLIPLVPGYHSVEVDKADKQKWIKQINVFAKDTVNISPVFLDLVPIALTPSTQKVTISTDVSGAKIVINDEFTGEFTPGYIMLDKGLYHLSLIKSGYDTYKTALWVGDTIAYGTTAISLATLAGVDVNGY